MNREGTIDSLTKGEAVNGMEWGAMAFQSLITDSAETASEKGFWDEPVAMDQYAAKLSLIHSEVTEVLEALRKNQGSDKVTEEFADIFIRCFDLYDKLVDAGLADDDLYAVIMEKQNKNAARPPKHGNKWG